jgi:hypothetical protein
MNVIERIRIKFNEIDADRMDNSMLFEYAKKILIDVTYYFNFEVTIETHLITLRYKGEIVLSVELLNDKVYFSSAFTDYAIRLESTEELDNAIVSNVTEFYRKET